MRKHDLAIDFDELISGGTGSSGEAGEYRTLVCPFDKYEVTIVLNGKNEFVDILEIKLNKEFVDFKQRVRPKPTIDEAEFYDKE